MDLKTTLKRHEITSSVTKYFLIYLDIRQKTTKPHFFKHLFTFFEKRTKIIKKEDGAKKNR